MADLGAEERSKNTKIEAKSDRFSSQSIKSLNPSPFQAIFCDAYLERAFE